MAIITKNIKGANFYYFHDRVKIRNGYKIISTRIGRTDLNAHDLSKVQSKKLTDHFVKLFRETAVVSSSKNNTTITSHINYLSSIRTLYNQISKNLSQGEIEFTDKKFVADYILRSDQYELSLFKPDVGPQNFPQPSNYIRVRKLLRRYRKQIDERLIKEIHRIIMTGVELGNGHLIRAGKYRTIRVEVKEAPFPVSPTELIKNNIKQLLNQYERDKESNVNTIALAALFHHQFEIIHPFEDGNGKTGREILNFMLDSDTYPMIYIPWNQKISYYKSLEEADKGNYLQLVNFILNRIYATLVYLHSNTSIYKTMKSNKMKQGLITKMNREQYDRFIKQIDYYHDSGEVP